MREWGANLTTERLLAAMAFVAVFAMAVQVPIDTDTYWHLSAGRWMVENRALISEDVFSYTRAETAWLNTYWLGQIGMYILYALLGPPGMALFTATIASVGMAFVWRMSAGNGYLRAFALILGAAAAAIFWSARPHMFSFLLSAAALYVLDRYRRTGNARWLWALPVLAALWANLHGGFIILFLLIAFTLAGEIAGRLFGTENGLDWRGIGRLALWALIAAAAISLNPFGPRLWTLPFYTFGMRELQNVIAEWGSPDFHNPQTWPFVMLFFGAFGAAAAARKKLDWTDAALLTGTGLLALWSVRNIATFALAATPTLTRYLDAWLDEHGWQIRAAAHVKGMFLQLNRFLLAVAVLAGLVKVTVEVLPARVDAVRAERLPVGALEWLRAEEAKGPMFNDYNWGGYLTFAYPEEAVFIDGRTDVYGDEYMRIYREVVLLGRDWDAFADEYGIRFALLPSGGLLTDHIANLPGWSLAYRDDTASVLVREGEGL